jgi:iron(III) transport system substrate-binding protein
MGYSSFGAVKAGALWRAGAAVVLAASLVASAHAQPAGDANWQAVVAAAKKEGTVVIYNGSNFPIITTIARKFQDTYGIKAQVLNGRASEMVQRIQTEQASNHFIGDLHYTGRTTLQVGEEQGQTQPHGPLPNASEIAPPATDDGTAFPTNLGNFAVMVNAKLVKPGEIKSWWDLANPKWKGKILSDDPRAAGGGNVWFEVTYEQLGADYQAKMALQNLTFARDYPNSERRVAAGEYAIYIPFNVSEIPHLQGLPIRTIVPKEGLPYVVFGAAMLKKAPHPNAARLFLNYMATPEIQGILAKEGYRPAMRNMGSQVPPDLKPYTVDAKLLGTTTPARQAEMLQLAKKLYK